MIIPFSAPRDTGESCALRMTNLEDDIAVYDKPSEVIAGRLNSCHCIWANLLVVFRH